MYRARMFTIIACSLLAGISLTGCSGADSQYANDGLLASGSAGGSIVDQAPSGTGSLFGLDGYDIGSGVANDTSITGSIPASYGSVPGSLSLNRDASLLSGDDDLSSSTPFDSIAMSDPTVATSLFDTDSGDFDSTIDGLVSATDTNFDSAMSNAQDSYGDGSMSSFDPSMDMGGMVDDPSLDMDPSAGLGPDSLPDF